MYFHFMDDIKLNSINSLNPLPTHRSFVHHPSDSFQQSLIGNLRDFQRRQVEPVTVLQLNSLIFIWNSVSFQLGLEGEMQLSLFGFPSRSSTCHFHAKHFKISIAFSRKGVDKRRRDSVLPSKYPLSSLLQLTYPTTMQHVCKKRKNSQANKLLLQLMSSLHCASMSLMFL